MPLTLTFRVIITFCAVWSIMLAYIYVKSMLHDQYLESYGDLNAFAVTTTTTTTTTTTFIPLNQKKSVHGENE